MLNSRRISHFAKRFLPVDPSHLTVLISARSGTFYILTLWLEKATNTVTSLVLSEAGTFTPAESITLIDDNLLFIGSSLSDSLLLRYRITSEKLGLQSRPPNGTLTNGTIFPPAGATLEPKRARLDSTASIGSTTELPAAVTDTMTSLDSASSVKTSVNPFNFDDTDVELYGPSIQQQTAQCMDIDVYNFEVLDCLRNIGPMANITAGEVPCLATGQTDPSDEVLTAAQSEMAHIELIASIARPLTAHTPDFQPPNSNVGGGIALLHRSVRAHGLTAFELPEYNSLWSLYGPPVGTFVEKESMKEEGEKEEGDQPPMNGNVGTDETVEDAPAKTDSPASNATSLVDEESSPKRDKLEATTVGVTGAPKANSNGTEVPTELEGDSTQQAPQEQEEEKTAEEHFSTPPPTPASSAELHSYLLLTREDSTMILEVGEEIVELEVSGFNTTETTVIAANLGQTHSQPSKSPPLGSMGTSPNAQTTPNESTSLCVGKDYPYILQVSPTSLRLLDGPRLLEHLQLTTEWRIYLASVTDPYVLVGTEDDDLILAALRDAPLLDETLASRGVYQGSSLLHQSTDFGAMDYGDQALSAAENLPFSRYLELSRPKVNQVSAPQCFCLYHDRSGRLARWLHFNSQADASLLWMPNQTDSTKNNNVDVDGETQLSALDEEDILLYGEVISTVKKEKVPSAPPVPEPASSPPLNQEDSQPTLPNRFTPTDLYFAFIVFSNGVLEIYSVPDFTCLYEVQQFSGLPNMLCDSRWQTEDKQTTNKPSKIASLLPEVEDIPPTIREISVFPMGTEHDRPVLLVRTTHEVVCYEALCPCPGEALPLTPGNPQVCGISPLRWRRLPIACPLLAPRRLRSDPRITDLQAKLTAKMSMLRPFEDIGGHRGVFVCGSQPMWLFATDRGHIRVFPHTIDGVMTSFAALNTAACPKGFVYFTHANEMRLATLPQGYSYEEELGIRSIQLDGRPHFVQYHLESKTYVVVSSHATEARTIFRLNAEGNKEEEEVKRPADCVYPLLDAYKLQVFSPVASTPNSSPNWELVPNSLGHDFELLRALRYSSLPVSIQPSADISQLASEQTIQGTKDYLALGSNLSYGEEIPVRGRILLIDIIEVVPEPGQPLTRHRVKTVFDGDQKGPVTALASCQGHLVSAVGQKIYIWTLKNGDLIGVAFVDTDLYIHSLLCVKNLVLAADVLKSIQLLRFQASMRVLSVVSRDTASREVFATNFFVDGTKLGFLITDKFGNLVVHSYDPMELASCSGRRLVPRADMRLPSRATTCLRVANRFRHPLLATRLLTAAADAAPADTAAAEKRSGGGGGAGPKPSKLHTAAVSGLFATFEAERSRHSVYLGEAAVIVQLVG
nr:unnamed protein product [Spirometra erinaceieuropaei]